MQRDSSDIQETSSTGSSEYELTSETTLNFDNSVQESVVTDQLLSAVKKYAEVKGQRNITKN